MFKRFFNWLFQPYEQDKEPYNSSASGKVIRCHDCGEYGYFVTSWEFGFDYQIPKGWQLVWYKHKPLFLCEKCQQKRREFGNKILNQ